MLIPKKSARSTSYYAIADYYDAEYQSSAMLAQDVPFFLKHLPKRRQSILELATGTARAAIPIAQAGHRVVGVDYDPGMLEIARQKRDSVGIAEKNLSLKKRDVLRLKLGEKFDWICLLFNTFLNFTTIEQQDQLLQGVRDHLKKTGRFWIDIFNPDLHRLAQPRSMKLDPVLFYVPHLDRTVSRLTEIRPDPVNQRQRVIFLYHWFDRDGRERRKRVSFDLTFMFPRELRLLMERNGLRIEKLYGDYDGSELTNDSPRIIACCRKS
ncbi:MAG TPA: class I SAM-dependent methyltransferase [Tepidisphaeraceae bacterium]|nr:class I SAM-dependent methyltransferase [Tepidisphaeraceae bacterium]